MDPLCTAAARALAVGAPLQALQLVALRNDAPALALRGIAMAQLGEFARSKELLRRASRAFGPQEPVAQARCHLARAEVALASRDLSSTRSGHDLESAVRTLEAHGDRVNALHARLVALRRLLLIGQVERAERALSELDVEAAPPMLVATGELVRAEIALLRVRTGVARAALERAQVAAQRTGISALCGEVGQARARLQAKAARLIRSGTEQALLLEEVEAVLASPDLIVDACRRIVRDGRGRVVLSRRPVLFALARALAETWPGGIARDALISRVFNVRRANASHRARLRVEIGRLRRAVQGLASIRATAEGFALAPQRAGSVAVLLPPIDGEGAAILALLSEGAPWSSSALAIALGQSQRRVQRTLAELEAASRVRPLGRARARRWVTTPAAGFTTTLLLPADFSTEY